MLIHEGDKRTIRIDVGLAIVLAAVAGAVNTAGFVAVGYYSANMTGNVSFASEYLVTGALSIAGMFSLIVITFIGGAFCAGISINAGRRRNWPAIYAMTIIGTGALLVVLGLIVLMLPDFGTSPSLILGMSFAMGAQNAVATRLTNARVRTTHVSGMATDIGLELSSLLDGARGKLPSDQIRLNAAKLALHCATIAAFLIGGVLGVVLYSSIGGAMLCAAGLILILVCLPELWRAHRNAS